MEIKWNGDRKMSPVCYEMVLSGDHGIHADLCPTVVVWGGHSDGSVEYTPRSPWYNNRIHHSLRLHNPLQAIPSSVRHDHVALGRISGFHAIQAP